jgi:DNA-binding response OmpR family regulator
MKNSNKKKILIIEDQPGFRLIYRGVLENDGYEVLEAADGMKGWEMACTNKPDIILLDLILPRLDGYKVLEKIRSDQSTSKIPVIIFSVLGSDDDIIKAIKLGANDYRIKGENSPLKILEKIKDLLKEIDQI